MNKGHHFFILAAIFFGSTTAFAVAPPAMRPGVLDFYYQGHYFNSDSNLGGDQIAGSKSGEEEKLNGNQNYENFTNLVEAGYTFDSGFRASGGTTFAYAQSSGFTDDRSTTEFGYLIGSAQYAVRLGSFVFIPAARLEYSLVEVDDIPDNNGEVMTNEAASGYQFGAWMSVNFWRLKPYLYLGYRIQDDDRANLAIWAAGLRFSTKKFWIDGEIFGQKVVVDDGADGNSADELERRAVIDTANGGSYRYYAVNPEFIEAEISAGFKITKDAALAAGLGHTLTGENTAYGLSMFARVLYDFQVGEGPRKKSLSRPKKRFKPDVEEYDESLFEED